MSSISGTTLTHNPNATPEEMLKFRENFNLHAHLNGVTQAPVDTPPVHITRDQVIVLCRAYSIDVVEGPGMKGGRLQNLEEKYEVLKAENATLRLERDRLTSELHKLKHPKSEETPDA